MKTFYVIAGKSQFYDKESNKWCKIADMRMEKFIAACTVFAVKIIMFCLKFFNS